MQDLIQWAQSEGNEFKQVGEGYALFRDGEMLSTINGLQVWIDWFNGDGDIS